MTFIPDSYYGLFYLAALVISSIASLLGSQKKERVIVWIMIFHWFSMRTINVINFDNFWLWIAQDMAMIWALAYFARTTAGGAIAVLFFVNLLFDQYTLFSGGSFQGAAAVAESIGYLSMLIMTGANHYGTPKRMARYGAGRNHPTVAGSRLWRGLDAVENRSAISPRSRLPGGSFSKGFEVVKKDHLNHG
jgi:hypothetical protein